MPSSPKAQESPDDQPVADAPPKRKNKNGKYKPGTHLQYSSDPALIKAEIAEYSAQYPWYKDLMEDLLATKGPRSNSSTVEYSFASRERRTSAPRA